MKPRSKCRLAFKSGTAFVPIGFPALETLVKACGWKVKRLKGKARNEHHT